MYAYAFLHGCVFLYPVMALMFQANDVSEIQITILLMSWAVFVMVLQPVLGIIGDKYSRKKILVFGQLCKLICFMIFLFFPHFWGYMLGFFFWGIEWGISASINKAFLYDELRVLGARHRYARVDGNMLSWKSVGTLLAVSGSYIAAHHGYNSVLWITMAMMIFGLFILLSIDMEQPESYIIVRKTPQPFFANFKKGVKKIFKIKHLFMTLVVLSFITGMGDSEDYVSLLGSEMGIRLEHIGLLFATARVAEIIGGITIQYAGKMSAFMINFIVVASGVAFAMMLFVNALTIWFVLFIGAFLCTIANVFLTTRVQNAIPSAQRATIMSIYDMISQVAILFIYAVIGFGVIFGGGYKLGYFLVGAFIAIMGVYAVMFLGDVKRKRAAQTA